MQFNDGRSVLAAESEPVVSCADHGFDRLDLVLTGFIDRSWPAFEHSVRAGLACERAADASGVAADPGLVRREAVAFRRARALVAGEQLRAWLAERGLSQDEWTAYLRRCVMRAEQRDVLGAVLARHPVPTDDVAAILLSEIACDGILQRCATTAVRWAAATSQLGLHSTDGADRAPVRVAVLADQFSASAANRLLRAAGPDVATRLGRLLTLEVGYQRFVAEISGEAALRDCLDRRRIDWLRLRCIELRLPDHDAAREALMCLRDDGLEPAVVARLAGGEMRELSVELQEAGPALASLLLSASAGDVIGPVPDDAGTTRLLVITERLPASLEDPDLRERARSEVVAAALEHLVAGMVRWHGHL